MRSFPCSPRCIGALFTAWIVLLVAQTALVAARRTDIHRTLASRERSWLPSCSSSALRICRDCGAMVGGQAAIRASSLPFRSAISFCSACWVGAAILPRQEPDTHKRLMLLAAILLLTAAVGRFLGQVGMGGHRTCLRHRCVCCGATYDLVSRGRLHPATLWGGAMVVGFKPLLFCAVSVTSPRLALADALRVNLLASSENELRGLLEILCSNIAGFCAKATSRSLGLISGTSLFCTVGEALLLGRRSRLVALPGRCCMVNG